MQAEDIDIQLWAYIDGTCTPDEQKRVEQLLAHDPIWENTYEELLDFHKTIQANVMTEPANSLLTDNIMAKIEATAPKQSTTSIALTWGIRAVAAFFVLTISGLLIYYISTADFNTSANSLRSISLDITIPPSVKNALSMLTGFTVLIFLLVAADSLFRKRMA